MKTYTQEWVQINISRRLLPITIMLVTVFLLTTSTGCKESTTAPNNSGQISMTAQYSPSDSPTGAFGMNVSTGALQARE